MINIGWDTETYLIGAPDQLIPKMVCSSWDTAQETKMATEWSAVYSTGDGDKIFDTLLRMWESAYQEESRIIIQNAPFDISVNMRFCHEWDNSRARDLYLLIWDTLEKSLDNEWSTQSGDYRPILVSDTIIRQKLYNLSMYGNIEFAKGRKALYGLDTLALYHLGVDISADKHGEDIWRLRYSELDNVPTSQWPDEAYNYALRDSTYARQVWEKQEAKRRLAGHGSMNSEALQVYAGTALQLASANGFYVDAKQRDRVMDDLNTQLNRIEPALRENGILRANGKVNTKVVKERVSEAWKLVGSGEDVLFTDKGDIATGKEVMEILVDFENTLQLYSHRQQLAKLRDAFLPNMMGDRVWTRFDILKETGRTSSMGNKAKKGQPPPYAAINSQQMPRRKGIRDMLSAGHGKVQTSVDYAALELCSVGQVTYKLFGRSVHRDKINAGYDLHSFLGSAIARLKMPEVVGHYTDHEKAYHTMKEYLAFNPPGDDQSSTAQDMRRLKSLAKKMRNMAKPTGLGFPGGLSVKTMCVFAKTVYHVNLTEAESQELRELWFETYPEMVDYFKWVREQVDSKCKSPDGKLYYYITPGLNRFRGGTTYCATANGMAMQSLSADGAKRGLSWIGRACAGGCPEDSPYRILEGCEHLTFIHDENIVALPDDDLATERAIAVQDLMVQAMQIHMPDVRISAEPAISRRWVKDAEKEAVADPGRQAAALDIVYRQYGRDTAAQVESLWSTPERLLPWDDIHGYQEGLG